MSRSRSSIAAAVLFMALTLPALVRADGYEKSERRLDAEVKLQLDRTVLTLSAHMFLTLTVEGPVPLEVERIGEITTSKDWEERAVGEPEIAILPNGRLRWRQTYRLEPRQPGKLELPVSPTRFRFGPKPPKDDWKWIEHVWKPIPVEVTSLVSVASLSELRDITPPETLPPEPASDAWKWGAGGGGAVLLGAAVTVWRRRRKRPRPTVALPPHLWALRELERIDALDLPGARDVERYHVLLSDVLRRYIELRFAVRAPEQTTPEFLEALRRSSTFAPEQQEQLREFLHRCDLAKFARVDYTPRECQAAADMARRFIEQTGTPTVAPAATNGKLLSEVRR